MYYSMKGYFNIERFNLWTFFSYDTTERIAENIYTHCYSIVCYSLTCAKYLHEEHSQAKTFYVEVSFHATSIAQKTVDWSQ